MTISTILKEMKDVPANRLDEVYQFIHSFTSKPKNTAASRKKILSFGGAFSDMSEKDYADFISHNKKVRANLFDRNTDV